MHQRAKKESQQPLTKRLIARHELKHPDYFGAIGFFMRNCTLNNIKKAFYYPDCHAIAANYRLRIDGALADKVLHYRSDYIVGKNIAVIFNWHKRI